MQALSRYLLAFLLLTLSLNLLAQEDTTMVNNPKQKVRVRAGIFVNTRLNYYGRTDSLRSSGIFPIVELWLDKHFYLSGIPVFIHNSNTDAAYAGTVTTAGYMFRSKKWGTHTFLVVPVYKDNSQLVQSALKFQLSSNVSKLSKWLNLTIGADLKYSDKLDYGGTAGIDHPFRMEPGKDWVIVMDPSAYINGGTQQFTNTSYKRNGFLILPGYQQTITEQVNHFNVLSYEFSMPTVFAKGHFQLVINPAYVIPRNLIMVPGRPDLSERGEAAFYLTAGCKVLL